MEYSSDDKPDVAGVLADRLAATLVHHEPGWRLPRPSALARRYNVRPAQVEQAVRELAARHLIRQLSALPGQPGRVPDSGAGSAAPGRSPGSDGR